MSPSLYESSGLSYRVEIYMKEQNIVLARSPWQSLVCLPDEPPHPPSPGLPSLRGLPSIQLSELGSSLYYGLVTSCGRFLPALSCIQAVGCF